MTWPKGLSPPPYGEDALVVLPTQHDPPSLINFRHDQSVKPEDLSETERCLKEYDVLSSPSV